MTLVLRVHSTYYETPRWILCRSKFQTDTPMTERCILSYTTSIFEPLGILLPVFLEPKLIQSLWKGKVDWDKEIPYSLKNHFERWKESLKNWNTAEICCLCCLDKNRFSLMLLQMLTVQLHTLDASTGVNSNVAFKCRFLT